MDWIPPLSETCPDPLAKPPLAILIAGALCACPYRVLARHGGCAPRHGFDVVAVQSAAFDQPDVCDAFLLAFGAGRFAFGAVFMATDPVSAAMTDNGAGLRHLDRLYVRADSRGQPAFPEGMMLAILFGNLFSPCSITSSCNPTSSGDLPVAKLDKDSLANTFLIAVFLCLVCSIVVSSMAVALKPFSSSTRNWTRKRTFCVQRAFASRPRRVSGRTLHRRLFAEFTVRAVDLQTGEYVDEIDV